MANEQISFKKIYNPQVKMTELIAKENCLLAQEIIIQKEKDKHLLDKYTVPYTLLGNCLRKAKINGRDYSIQNLDLIEQHNNITQHIDFNRLKLHIRNRRRVWSKYSFFT